MQDSGERFGVGGIAHRLRCDRVDRPGQADVVQRAVVHVEQVVEPDPGQPLPAVADAAAQTGGEQRPEKPQRAAAGGLDDARAHANHPQSGLDRGLRRRLPVRDDIGEDALAAHTPFAQHGVATVEAVDADRRRTDERVRSFRRACSGLREALGRSDAAVADPGRVRLGEAPGDRRTGQVHDGVDTGQQAGRGPVGIPLPLVG